MNPFPSVLNLKREEIDTVDKRKSYTMTVVGCGQQGLALGVALADAGFRVILADPDQSVIKRVTKGKSGVYCREFEPKFKNLLRSGRLSATSDLKSAVSQGNAIVITINPRITDKRNVDYSEVEKALKQVGTNLERGTMIIYTGIAGIGFMENIAKEKLVNTSGLEAGEDFGLAYAPIRVFNRFLPPDFIGNSELRVAADNKTSLDAASAIFMTIFKDIRQITSFKTAELAMLFSAVRWDANLALTNELATLCENADIDYLEIMKLLEAKLPSATLVPTIDEQNMKEAQILLENAEDLGAKLRFATLARQLNKDMVKHAIRLTKSALRSCGRTLRRSKITVIGTADPETAETKFIRMLEAKGAKAIIFDPLETASRNSARSEKKKRTVTDAAECSDCIVFLQGQELLENLNFKSLKTVMHSPAAIVDLSGDLEPGKVETEGFIYRGLGRVAGKK